VSSKRRWRGFIDNLFGVKSLQRESVAKAKDRGDFTRQENWIRGNTRTVKRQYTARKLVIVRLLPGIAAYCRVVGPVEIWTPEWDKAQAKNRGEKDGPLGERALPPYRFVPPGTAWDRINFFSAQNGRKNGLAGLGRAKSGHRRSDALQGDRTRPDAGIRGSLSGIRRSENWRATA